jgi:antitoxin MazE
MFGLLEAQSASIYLVDTCMPSMKATVKKWGNSAAVRIPAAVMEAADIHLEDVVKVSEEKGRIIIEPIRSKTYDVNDLIKAITSRNLHEPIDFGRPEGGEVW